MPAILIDTDIIIDVLLNQQPFAETSLKVLELFQDGKIKAFVTATIITNIYYVVRKQLGRSGALRCLRILLETTNIGALAIDKGILLKALNSGMTDFEDAVQAEAAETEAVNCIVTRNLKDFKNSKVPALSPDKLLELLNKT